MNTPPKDQVDNQNGIAPIKLLWTGGWDSTYRLLHLLLLEKKMVQPYYIVDHERKSTENEFDAMEVIKKDLLKKFPQTKNLLRATITGYRNQIKANPEITRKWQQLSCEVKLGRQYDWLARYADQHGLSDLELGHEKKLKPSLLEKVILQELTGEGHECRVKDDLSHENALSVFKYFRFPIYYVTKMEMEQVARENGFLEILQKVWFCHRPRKNGKPCEFCLPCREARRSGYSHGLPRSNYLRDKYLEISFKYSKNLERVEVKIKRIIPKLARMVRL